MKKSLLLLAALTLVSCASQEPSSSSSSSSSSQAPVTFTLSFDPNGGTLNVKTITVEEGKSANLPTPTKEGKEFRGWWTGFGGNDAHVDNLTPITRDLSLIAEWSEYDLTFLDGQGDTCDTQTVNPGDRAIYPDVIPTKASTSGDVFHFTGWDFDFSIRVHKDYSIQSLYHTEPAKSATLLSQSSYFSGDLNMPFLMYDSLFTRSAKGYAQPLAELSFGLSASTLSKDTATPFFQAIGFDNVVFSDGFDTPTTDSIGYAIAHKKIGESDLIAVSVRGYDYGQEWASNFKVGSSGTHAGFEEAADKAKKGIERYVDANYPEGNKLYWVAGYSRAGATANVLSDDLLRDDSGKYNEDNLFVYTFEAPRAIPIDKAIAWENVFNIVNAADLIARLLPEEYGLARCGNDVDIYDANIDAILKEVKEDFDIGTFVPSRADYETEPDLTTYLVRHILDYAREEYEEYKKSGKTHPFLDNALCDRSLYVKNYQEDAIYLLGIVFGIKRQTRLAIVNDLKTKAAEQGLMSVMMIFLSGKSLHDYIKPFLDQDGVAYDDEKLATACGAVPKLISGPGSTIVPLLANEESRGAVIRIIAHHMPEVNYALLKAHRA